MSLCGKLCPRQFFVMQRVHNKCQIKATDPKFCKARPLPVTLKPKIKHEIDILVKNKVSIPIKILEWTTPVVPSFKTQWKYSLWQLQNNVNPSSRCTTVSFVENRIPARKNNY